MRSDPGVTESVSAGLPAAAGAPAAGMPMLGGPASALALALTMFVEAVGYGVVAPTLPFLARTAGAGEAQIGFLVGLYAAVGLVAGIPFGALANRFGRRSLVLVGLGCLTVSSFGFVFAPTYVWLVAARFVQGLGATAIWVGALTMAADLSPDSHMGRTLSWITGSWSLGFVGLGVRTTLAGFLKVLRLPAVLASAAATFALAFFYGATEAFLPLLADQMNVKRIGIGFLFAVAGLPSVALPRLAGLIADRVGDARLILWGLVYAAVLNASFLALTGVLPLWALFFLFGLVEVLIYVPAVALLNRGLHKDDRGFATGSHSYAFSAGFFLGPLIGGLLMPLGSYPLLFATLTAVMLAAIGALLALRGRLKTA